jgi:NhaA family Na+:H+ antiporter
MSLFITNLAFVDPQLVDAAKASIFAASLLAGIAGFALLSLTGKKRSSSASS